MITRPRTVIGVTSVVGGMLSLAPIAVAHDRLSAERIDDFTRVEQCFSGAGEEETPEGVRVIFPDYTDPTVEDCAIRFQGVARAILHRGEALATNQGTFSEGDTAGEAEHVGAATALSRVEQSIADGRRDLWRDAALAGAPFSAAGLALTAFTVKRLQYALATSPHW